MLLSWATVCCKQYYREMLQLTENRFLNLNRTLMRIITGALTSFFR